MREEWWYIDETDNPTDDKDRNHNESYYSKMPNHFGRLRRRKKE